MRCPHLTAAVCSVCAELADARATIERLTTENRKATNAVRNDRAKRSSWRKRAEAAEATIERVKALVDSHRPGHWYIWPERIDEVLRPTSPEPGEALALHFEWSNGIDSGLVTKVTDSLGREWKKIPGGWVLPDGTATLT